jgi:predicted nucleic acid-binding protein
MRFLLDTNVISEMRKAATTRIDRRVAAWAKEQSPDSLYLSVITILEIESGTLRLTRRDPRQAAMFRTWIDTLILPHFSERILSIDLEVVRRCAPLHFPNPRPERDAWIAATALLHGMTVVTRNVKDFEPMGVPVLNPWEW